MSRSWARMMKPTLVAARHPKDDGRLHFQSVHISRGRGVGVPGLRFFRGGVPGLRFFCGGGPGLSKGKIFWHQIWLDTCSNWKKKFLSRDPPPLSPSKGKNFWHQIWLDTCSDWKKKILSRDPPSKGKNFDTRFGLIHVQTGKKNFCQGTPHPPSKGKNFWHQIWLDTCSDWEKKFLSRAPPPPGIARNCYGHAAGGMPLAFTQEDFLVLSDFGPKEVLIFKSWVICTN